MGKRERAHLYETGGLRAKAIARGTPVHSISVSGCGALFGVGTPRALQGRAVAIGASHGPAIEAIHRVVRQQCRYGTYLLVNDFENTVETVGMVIEHTSQNVEHATHFLKERILATAAATNTVLSGAEIAMLTYSASEESPEPREMIQDVDSQIGEEAYEHKVANLIRSAYKHDVAHGMEDEWKEHLRALRGEDLYVLTMADRAGVFKDGGFSRHALPSVDTVCLAALGGAGFVFFFTRIGSDAITSAGVRIVLFPLWVAALWAVGEWSRRRIGRR